MTKKNTVPRHARRILELVLHMNSSQDKPLQTRELKSRLVKALGDQCESQIDQCLKAGLLELDRPESKDLWITDLGADYLRQTRPQVPESAMASHSVSKTEYAGFG